MTIEHESSPKNFMSVTKIVTITYRDIYVYTYYIYTISIHLYISILCFSKCTTNTWPVSLHLTSRNPGRPAGAHCLGPLQSGGRFRRRFHGMINGQNFASLSDFFYLNICGLPEYYWEYISWEDMVYHSIHNISWGNSQIAMITSGYVWWLTNEWDDWRWFLATWEYTIYINLPEWWKIHVSWGCKWW
jgi:hypothetical protein